MKEICLQKGKRADKVLQRWTSRGEKERLFTSLLLSAQTLKPGADINWGDITFLTFCLRLGIEDVCLQNWSSRKLGKLKWLEPAWTTPKMLSCCCLSELYSQKKIPILLLCSRQVQSNPYLPNVILLSERLLSFTTKLCKSYEDGHVFWIPPHKLQKTIKKWNKNQRKDSSGHVKHNVLDNMLW